MRTYPLTEQKALENLYEAAKELSSLFPNARMFALGRTPLWFLEMAKLLDENPERYSSIAFSKNWYELGEDGSLQQSQTKALTTEQIASYRDYLSSIHLDLKTIISQAEGGKKTVIVDYVREGKGIASFLSILSDWAEEENLGVALRKAMHVHCLEEPLLKTMPPFKDFTITHQNVDSYLVNGLTNSNDDFDDSLGMSYPPSEWKNPKINPLNQPHPSRNAMLVLFTIMDFLVKNNRHTNALRVQPLDFEISKFLLPTMPDLIEKYNSSSISWILNALGLKCLKRTDEKLSMIFGGQLKNILYEIVNNPSLFSELYTYFGIEILREGVENSSIPLDIRFTPRAFGNTLEVLIEKGITREQLKKYFINSPRYFLLGISVLSQLGEALNSLPFKDGAIDIASLLEQKQKRLDFSVYNVVTINAIDGMLRAFNVVSPVNVFYGGDIELNLLKKRFQKLNNIKFSPIDMESNNMESNSKLENGLSITFGEDRFFEWKFPYEDEFFPYDFFKYNLPMAVPEEERSHMKKSMELSPNRKVWVIASPSQAEMEIIMNSYSRKPAGERPLLIVEMRLGQVKKEAKIFHGYEVLIRTDNDVDYSKPFNGLADGRPMGAAEIVFLNTTGELRELLSIADIPIIGDGHNLMEPISQGRVPLFFNTSGYPYDPKIEKFLEKWKVAEVINPENLSSQIDKCIKNAASMNRKAILAFEEFQKSIIMEANKFFASIIFVKLLMKSQGSGNLIETAA